MVVVMKLDRNSIRQFAEESVYDQGQALFQQGCVELTKVEIDHFDAIIHTDKAYQVRIRKTQSGLFALCTCPSWSNCEHAVAALLGAREYYDTHLDEMLYRKSHPSWQNFCDDILATDRQNTHQNNTHSRWKIVYLLKLEGDSWSILPQKAYIKKSGDLLD